MKLLIEIPKEEYEDIIHDEACGLHSLTRAIANGTPLPEHHGDLKDVDAIVKAIESRVEFLRENDAIFMRLRKDIDILGCIPKIRCEVPTIIPATKGEEYGSCN